MMNSKHNIFLICCAFTIGLIAGSCQDHYVPRPRGYYRIAIPDTAYIPLIANGERRTANGSSPYTFDLSTNATVTPRTSPDEKYWIDITYPAFDAHIHCTYYPIRNNLRELSDEAQDFVYKHAGKATSIPEQGFANDDSRVYGVFYALVGNTASPYQFYLTDSTRHFFRGAVYFNCTPNQDSLAPVIDYLQHDVRHLMETFRWQ